MKDRHNEAVEFAAEHSPVPDNSDGFMKLDLLCEQFAGFILGCDLMIEVMCAGHYVVPQENNLPLLWEKFLLYRDGE